jgi:hypothetical protein
LLILCFCYFVTVGLYRLVSFLMAVSWLLSHHFPCGVCCCVACSGCGRGYQWPDQGTGWDVAALSDSHPEYSGSCGRCYEVKCTSMSFKDGYGDSLSRDGQCR